ncbi:MAG: flagellar hook capping FlgD N-terminal domain-containing protein [Candidatus Zixiibacteriota bacterium]
MSFISPVATDASGQQRQTGSMQSLGKDDFLQLLVTKLQNQDPLQPMQDEDFIAQLAQFSSLEQMNNIAEGISTSNQWDYLQMQSLNNAMASSLIGKDIKAEYSAVHVDASNKPEISFRLDGAASTVEFVIKDASGNTVTTLSARNLSSGVNSIEWDGTDLHGNRVDQGDYTVSALATRADGETFTPSLTLVGTVETILYHNGSAYVTVGGLQIPLGDIAAVGEAGSFKDQD